MKALLIKETTTCRVITLLKKHNFEIKHYIKIEDIEAELKKILNPQEIALIIVEASFLFNAFLRHQKSLPKIKKHHGKSARFRFLQRNLTHFKDQIKKESLIALGFQNYQNHQKWAEEMKVKFASLREVYYLENQIKLAKIH